MHNFGHTAKGLARNPLGIIALFIVMVYGFASLVTGFAGAFTPAERMPLVYFMIIFPILVLIAFCWLVSKHSEKLFGPGDFKDEKNYVRMQLAAVASLTAATSKEKMPTYEKDIESIVELVSDTVQEKRAKTEDWKNKILWVDDRPDNNIFERHSFEAMGIQFTLALSTQEALKYLENNRYAAIISDMGRVEGPREGYVLLDKIRSKEDNTPFFIYAGSNAPEHKLEARNQGAQGSTNSPYELFQIVTQALLKR